MWEIWSYQRPKSGCGRRYQIWLKLASCDSVEPNVCCELEFCMFAGRPDRPQMKECNDCRQLREIGRIFTSMLQTERLLSLSLMAASWSKLVWDLGSSGWPLYCLY